MADIPSPFSSPQKINGTSPPQEDHRLEGLWESPPQILWKNQLGGRSPGEDHQGHLGKIRSAADHQHGVFQSTTEVQDAPSCVDRLKLEPCRPFLPLFASGHSEKRGFPPPALLPSPLGITKPEFSQVPRPSWPPTPQLTIYGGRERRMLHFWPAECQRFALGPRARPHTKIDECRGIHGEDIVRLDARARHHTLRLR